MVERLREAAVDNGDERVLLRFDEDLPYGEVLATLNGILRGLHSEIASKRLRIELWQENAEDDDSQTPKSERPRPWRGRALLLR